MKRLVLLALSHFLFSLAGAAENDVLSQKLLQLNAKLISIPFAPVQLDFAATWRNLSAQDNNGDVTKAQLIVQEVHLLNERYSEISFCQRVTLDEIKFNAELIIERQALLGLLEDKSFSYHGSFAKLPNSQSWYLHWLKSWLLAEVKLDELQAIAMAELADVKQERQAISQSNLPHNIKRYEGNDQAAITQAFLQREQRIYQHLSNILASDFKANPVNISASTLPKSFPAPGIYNSVNQTFMYHLQGENFPDFHMDWLFLHEAVPGHHFQSQFVRNKAKCQHVPNLVPSTIFIEGWAAYVESFGSELGLYTDKESAEYALDWQALRAVRVLLDIGIHYHGWSDEQAARVWMDYIPQQRAIMAREIGRIRQWPIQVITYVYGKAMIQKTVNRLLEKSPDIPLPEAHVEILRLSNLSLSSLNHLK